MFKKDDNTDKGNYRPISILPTISKIFERLMFPQITSFIGNVISPYLCGFRKGYSTQHALLLLMNKVNKCLDIKQKVGLFMMDLSKAFDCISHDLIIAKLYAYGFDKSSLKLIYSYLKGRSQRVKINANYSSWKEIINGVPQGSVLGPLLFNIFLNDIFYFVNENDICNYADDNTLSVADVDIENIIKGLETNISVLNRWFSNNSQILNGDKCQLLIIESSRSLRNESVAVNVGNIVVEEKQNGKLLGITIDKHNTMGEHIKKMCKQASNKLSALARISSVLSEHKRKILMKSFVTSQFSYCPIVWMYCQRQSNNLINRIHERALRITYNDYLSDFANLLRKDGSVTIHQKNVQMLASEVYKTLNDRNPIFMKEIFTLKQHQYDTRKKQLQCKTPRTVMYGLDTFGYKANQIWNSIPSEVQSDVTAIKSYIENHADICTCNLCKLYIQNIGFIDNTN